MRRIFLFILVCISFYSSIACASTSGVAPVAWVKGKLVNNSSFNWTIDLVFTAYGQDAWASSLPLNSYGRTNRTFLIEMMEDRTAVITLAYKNDALKRNDPLCRFTVTVAPDLHSSMSVTTLEDAFITCKVSQDPSTNDFIITVADAKEIA